MVTKTVSKSLLKAKMLEYFREVERTGKELIVTDNKKPVLKIVPIKEYQQPEAVFAGMREQVEYHEDLLTSTEEEWDEV